MHLDGNGFAAPALLRLRDNNGGEGVEGAASRSEQDEEESEKDEQYEREALLKDELAQCKGLNNQYPFQESIISHPAKQERVIQAEARSPASNLV